MDKILPCSGCLLPIETPALRSSKDGRRRGLCECCRLERLADEAEAKALLLQKRLAVAKLERDRRAVAYRETRGAMA